MVPEMAAPLTTHWSRVPWLPPLLLLCWVTRRFRWSMMGLAAQAGCSLSLGKKVEESDHFPGRYRGCLNEQALNCKQCDQLTLQYRSWDSGTWHDWTALVEEAQSPVSNP